MPNSTTEETTTETPEVTDTPVVETPPAGDGDKGKVFDEVYVKSLRAESAKHRTDLRAKETEATALAARVATYETDTPVLTTRATTAEALATRYEIALEKGLTIDLAKRLIGATREEMAADADVLVKALGTKAPPADLGQGTRTPPPGPKANMNDALRAFAGK